MEQFGQVHTLLTISAVYTHIANLTLNYAFMSYSFNNLAILVLCLGLGSVVGIGAIVYFKVLGVKGPMQESFLNSA